jgi:hypothetical protein
VVEVGHGDVSFIVTGSDTIVDLFLYLKTTRSFFLHCGEACTCSAAPCHRSTALGLWLDAFVPDFIHHHLFFCVFS